MRTLRRFVVALVLAALCGPLVPQVSADGRAQRRHPRPQQHRERQYRDHGRQYRPQHHYRQYRPYRPYYRYQRPRHHYWAPQYLYNCRVWFRGYWAYDRYGEYWVPGHYGFVPCR